MKILLAPGAAVALLLPLLSRVEPGLCALELATQQGKELKVGRLMKTCEKCHMDVYEEWSASGHSRAWTSPTVQAEMAKQPDKGESCARCHAPGSLTDRAPGELPVARSDDRELGVNCVTCHVSSDKKYHGPLPSQGHGGVVVHEEYRRAVWCKSCHGHPEANEAHDQFTSYSSSPAARAGRTCQECHMRPVERQLVKSRRPLKGVQPPQPCRRHDFAAILEDGLVADAAQLELRVEGGSLRCAITPHDGHHLPAGEGREVQLSIRFLDAAGATKGSHSEVYSQSGGNALPPGRTTVVEAALPAGATAASAELEVVRPVTDGRSTEERRTLARASTSP